MRVLRQHGTFASTIGLTLLFAVLWSINEARARPQAQGGAPTLVTYQGALADDTGPVSGTVTLGFEIYDGPNPDSATKLWEETQTDVSVSDGFFTVLLGSVNPLAAGVFEEPVRHLRVVVNGVGLPTQQFSAVPYALQATHAQSAESAETAFSVGWNNITGRPAGLDDGDDIGSGGIDSANAGPGLSVQTNGSTVTYSVDFAGSGSAATAARSDHTHDERYYTEDELTNSGGGGQVHWNNVTNRPAGLDDGDDTGPSYSAGTGLALNGTQFNVVSLPFPLYSNLVVDDGGGSDVGSHSDIAIGIDGLPVISYYDASAGDLKVAKCQDMACAGATVTTVDGGSDDVGQYGSIAIGSNGFPIIAYYNASVGDLILAICNNLDCTDATVTTLDSGGGDDVGQYASLVITTDGYPFVVYYNVTDTDLKFARCLDATCDGAPQIGNIHASASDVGQYTSAAVSPSGNVYVSYYDATAGDLLLRFCNPSTCGSGVNVRTLAATDDSGQHTDLVFSANGNPTVAYRRESSGTFTSRVVHCEDEQCNSVGASNLLIAGPAYHHHQARIGPDGLPFFVFTRANGTNLYLVRCVDLACSGVRRTNIVSAAADYPAVTVGMDGMPILSFYQPDADELRVIHCSDRACIPFKRGR